MIYLVNNQCILERKLHSAGQWHVLHMLIRSGWLMVLFKSPITLLMFSQVVLSIIESADLSNYVDLSPPFNSISICFI